MAHLSWNERAYRAQEYCNRSGAVFRPLTPGGQLCRSVVRLLRSVTRSRRSESPGNARSRCNAGARLTCLLSARPGVRQESAYQDLTWGTSTSGEWTINNARMHGSATERCDLHGRPSPSADGVSRGFWRRQKRRHRPPCNDGSKAQSRVPTRLARLTANARHPASVAQRPRCARSGRLHRTAARIARTQASCQRGSTRARPAAAFRRAAQSNP